MVKYFILIIILLNGCELFTNYKTVKVSLPKELPPWFQDMNTKTGKVFYPGVSGQIESTTITWSENFCIEVEKGSCIPIACYPSGYLKPVGKILNYDLLPGQNLQLNWTEGFLADLLLDLLKKGIPIDHLNVKRLSKEIRSECEGDPWSIDKELLMDAIIYNSLSVYKIKSEELKDITIPVTGEWISDNPFFPHIFSTNEGEISIEGIYSGLHRFMNPETEEQLDILVWDDGYEYLVY